MRPISLDEDYTTNPMALDNGSDIPVTCVNDDGIIRYYSPDGAALDLTTIGSWRIPFSSEDSAAVICRKSIKAGAVAACAHDDRESGLIYFYVDGTSDDAQRTLLTWLRDNDLLPRNPDGSFIDIPYAYDVRSSVNQTPDAKLSDYID